MAAKKLEEVYECFRYKPIAREEFEALYEPADKVRGKPVCDHLRRRLTDKPDGRAQILFAGHRSCGKSTELIRLQRAIEQDFLVVKYSVIEFLDPNNINKDVIRKRVEPRLSDLIDNCNLLIDMVKSGLPTIGKKGLVLIVEDLDKVNSTPAAEIFYDHSPQITQLHCHCIFSFPISLLYNIKFGTINNCYDGGVFVLPMIKVRTRAGDECSEGRQVLRNIVGRRMDLSLIEEPGLTEMIVYSGGSLQGLFRMIRDAADNALDRGARVIDRDDCLMACATLKNDYEMTIAEDKAKGISAHDYYQALKDCALDPAKKPDNTEIMLDLRHNLTVLSYNGENWSDVHPAVRDILKEKGLITG